MKILVINAGSSSLKYQLIDMQDESVLAKGNCERIGIDGKFTHKTADGKVIKRDVAMPDHTAAFNIVKDALLSGEGKVIDSLDEVSAIGHRIVQGGAKFDHSVLVDEQVVKDIEGYSALAPLHNPARAGYPCGYRRVRHRDSAGRGVRHLVPPDHAAVCVYVRRAVRVL